MTGADSSETSNRLFVPLKTEHYRAFESGDKDTELRGYSARFNMETVTPGRRVELRRGYSTGDSLWGVVEHVRTFDSALRITRQMDHTRILPESTPEEFLASVEDLLGGYERFIAFKVGGVSN